MEEKSIRTELPPADLLPVGRRASLVFRALRLVLTPLFRALFRIRIEGRQNIPGGGAFVIAANHLGWLDSFLILMAFPCEPRVHFLGAVRGLAARRVQWWLVRMVGGYIPVDMDRRGDSRLFRHTGRCLERGGAVAFYPEACYGRPGELQPFRKGFAHFATKLEVPVVPVALHGTERLWLRREVRVTIGQPVSGHQVEQLVEQTRAALIDLLSDPAPAAPRRRLLEAPLTNLF